MSTNPEIPETDLAEQTAPVDPTDDDLRPDGGPDDADEADWIDQRTEAPLERPDEP
ncbi:hypothetical protein [Tessaracoccus palaemonis]|uniref:Uncharacterized protein n=1 Tax=Tessaracoccus palaemonis TaxID=2829499 RepID=A0ABX8SM32_9ACTN|nr:hypothetical protein [Tessaracoccus palaemonis]QXT63482.1 hypothetical protein KDB89_03100 [Tessaracoccus palaemonis]